MTGLESQLPKLSLICLGAPTVRVGGAPPDGSVIWRKNLALLIYLALAEGKTNSRGHLVGLLWPEKPEEKARHSLNEAIRRLRSALGADRLISKGDRLSLADVDLEVDAFEFEQIVRDDPAVAIDIPTGEFLDGLVIEDAAPFEQWVAVQRERYSALWAGALVTVADAAIMDDKLAHAQALARRALKVQPFNELAVRILIRAAALAGDVSGAQMVFRDFQTRILEELDATPSLELVGLIDRVRDQRWWAGRGEHQAGNEPRLVGRFDLHRMAFGTVCNRTRRAKCLVVTGGPGMGKTRLLNECLARASLDGALTLVARPLESDQDTAWSTLRSMIRAGLGDASGMAGAPPHALSTLAALVPDLAQRFTPVEPQDRGEIVQALVSFFAAVCDEQEIVIAFDDAHLADRSTLGVLEAALPQIRDLPIGIVLSVGTSVAVPPELLRLQSAVGHAVSGRALELDPLDKEAVKCMVEELAPWCKNAGDVDRLTRRLLFEVEGNPQLAVTILRALGEHALPEEKPMWPRPRATIETPLPFTIPPLLRSAVLARIECLDGAARNVLEAASAGYIAIEPGLVAALLDINIDDVERHLETLERQDFVRYQDGRHVFAAPLLKKAIEEACLTDGQRRRWAKKSIAFLGERRDSAASLLRVELYTKTGENDRAFDESMSIAHAAMADGSYGTARRALAAADVAAGEDGTRSQRVSTARKELSAKPLPEDVRR